MVAKAIRARGIVQGVGFRPTVWRLAQRFGLTGAVWNDGQGVMIHAYGHSADMDAFIATIANELPPLAKLEALEITDLPDASSPNRFEILASQQGQVATAIVADAATCPDCLADISDPNNRRYRYPFTNCTHCGPRLSIVNRIPYDRSHTSMARFTQCALCQQEYDDPSDRRFHAQANCCPVCGPAFWLEDSSGQKLTSENDYAGIRLTADFLRQGRVVAIKGLGGFHLACDASNTDAVNRLRQRKQRYAKPFALMASDVEQIDRYAYVNAIERQVLQDKAAPIVILTAKNHRLPRSISPDSDSLGFMLPYTPLHSLLMQVIDAPIVLTSGNRSEQPQCIDNDEARSQLVDIADYFLLHNRAIVNRLDDSVVRVSNGNTHLLRRARGYCPESLRLPPGFENADGVLAMGGELKNSFCLIKQGQAIVAQHVGDLENATVQQDYRQAITLYRQLHDFTPTCIAVDKHPSYLSSQYGQALAQQEQLVLSNVQHHHAHLAACLAENAISLNHSPVLAAIFDGLGLGDDGQLWGGEFLLGDYRQCTRLAYFQPIAMLGGSQAIREPWRNSYAQLAHYFTWDELKENYADLAFIQQLNSKPLALLDTMLAKKLNSLLSSSCGRWFDAFAAALGVHAETISYEGQAAVALETLAASAFVQERAYPNAHCLTLYGQHSILSWATLWRYVLDDLKQCVATQQIAARIHHSLAAATIETLLTLSLKTGVSDVVLSGGVFQNRLLLEAVSNGLRRLGKNVLLPKQYPMNDGGLALGQAAIVSALTLFRE